MKEKYVSKNIDPGYLHLPEVLFINIAEENNLDVSFRSLPS